MAVCGNPFLLVWLSVAVCGNLCFSCVADNMEWSVSADNHRQPQTTTDIHRHPQTSTDNHRQPQTTTDIHRQLQTSTDNHRHPQTSTDNYRLLQMSMQPAIPVKHCIINIWLHWQLIEGSVATKQLSIVNHRALGWNLAKSPT